MIDSIVNNETGVSVRGKLNDAIDAVNSISDPVAEISPVVHYHGITGLTGGGATKLDGIVTEDVDVGIVVAITIDNNTSIYRLLAGTTAENSPFFIRPDDYAGGTNEKVWRLMSLTCNAFIARGVIRVLAPDGLAIVTSFATDGSGIFSGTLTIATPTETDHAATKGYVDGLAGTGSQGSGSPEGVVASAPCRLYRNTDTGALWWKVSGSGNTGWEQLTGPF